MYYLGKRNMANDNLTKNPVCTLLRSGSRRSEVTLSNARSSQVGGVRQVIRPRKSESDKTDKAKPSEEEVEEFGEEKKEKPSTAVVSGAKTGQWHETCRDSQLHINFVFVYISLCLSGESEAFPRAAVQSYHEKPQPTHEKAVNQKPNIIQQPRKC